ncbi:NACHT domain-containing protein [Streptomyces sp. NPDC102360]|uniref:NACHT domain-containing protein n=1 Tax=Streptomyces sp. NPDC102360 TaxID=3366160 RepID=UPI0037F865E8
MGDATGAVADFCATLRRTVRGCGVPQTELARILHRSDASVSTLLTGQRAKPPQLDEVLAIVNHCRRQAGAHSPPGIVLDPAWWRTRHAELQETEEDRQRKPPRHDQERLPLELPEFVPFDFESAVEVLTGRRDGFEGVVSEILGPLDLVGARPGELSALLKSLGSRVRTCRGTARTALLCSADLVLLVGAFCDAVGNLGSVRDPQATTQMDIRAQVLEELGRVVPGSVRARSPSALRADIASAYAASADLMAFAGFNGASPDKLARLALRRYDALQAAVTWDCPELRLTSETYDPDEAENRQPITADRVGLIELGVLLGNFTHADSPTTRQRQLLRAPISAADGSGPAIPSLAAGYINPAYRVAGRAADWQLSADTWWDEQPLSEDIAGFLAAHLLGHQATQSPLLILGHPGSGKSLLMRLIAARLPQSEFSCLHIELRHVPVELDLQEQLEWAVHRSTGSLMPWPDALPSGEVIRVVLLDGLDELIQAGAGRLDMSRQWRYLKNIEQLQLREYELGRPVVFVVTSRTVVADQVLAPLTATVLRLEPFDDQRIVSWLEVWQSTNRRYFSEHDVMPLTWDVIRPYRELARHSLLLLMLALYDATGNPLRSLGGWGIRRVDLYERILVEFVRRQVVKHDGPLPPSLETAAVEREFGRLGAIAFGMFNRRRQSLTASEADSDLGALFGEADSALLFGRFFFVHEAQATVAEERLRSYEFLHATFGEYLVARLICDELNQIRDTAEPSSDRGHNDAVLRCLLSFVPLSDRANVVDYLREMAGPEGPRWNGELPKLLRNLFHTEDRAEHGPSQTAYAPAVRRRTERDAVYEANLLLLALVIEGGVRASDFLSVADPVDRWWRYAQFWRSQFGEASWDSFAHTVSVKRVTPTPASNGKRDSCQPLVDLELSLQGTTELAHDVSWMLRHDTLGPAGYHDARGVDAGDLTTRLALLCDADVQHVLHALAPLMRSMPNTLRTYRIDREQHTVSGAHALIALLCRPLETPLTSHYSDVLELLRHLPEHERMPVAGILVRQVVHDADALPEETLRALLVEILRLGAGVDGMLWAGLWPTLEEYVLHGLTQLPPEPDSLEYRALLGHIRHYAAQFHSPRDQLRQMLRDAGSTYIWAESPWGSDVAALEHGLALLKEVPAEEQTAGLIIGLLRLANELGDREWLGTHAEPLLLSLHPREIPRLRASDADFLSSFVWDAELLNALKDMRAAWRGPSEDSRPEQE